MIDRLGIASAYEDAFGRSRATSDETRAAIVAAMGVNPAARRLKPRVCVIDLRKPNRPRLGPGELRLEDGAVLQVPDRLPVELPLGYHDFYDSPRGRERRTRVIVTPGACHAAPTEPVWGWAAQLYAARSRGSWGMGDLADLKTLARWASGQGAALIQVNPLPAVDPVLPQESSPYFPTSRRFRNPLYLRIEEVPGAETLGAELTELATAGKALNAEPLILRDDIFRLKQKALEKIWQRVGPTVRDDARFRSFCKSLGASLREFAVYCVLSEKFGGNWDRWDIEYRRPETPAVARFAAENADRVVYHEWLQWLLDLQLAAVEGVAVMQDLPIGFSGRGADAWTWQDVLADGVTVGAPPDLYNTQGQNWGFPPWIPTKLQEADYQPFVETIRAMLRHAGGLRIDHVMGLFRLFWIPAGMSAVDGTYVTYPAADLLNIISLESHRAGAFVVGEDLGTVGQNVRRMLAAAGILSTRLLYFEKVPPTKYPKLAMAAVTTHDLPTIAGLWSGSDLKAQDTMGLQPDAAAFALIHSRLQALTKLPPEASKTDVVRATYDVLGHAQSAVVTATLEDALAVEERPNMPATTHEWPNWRIALPEPLEDLMESPLAAEIASSLGRARHRASSGQATATPSAPSAGVSADRRVG